MFRSDYEDEVSYSIQEVYTTDDGVRWTTDEMSPRGETLRGLADDLERMRKAFIRAGAERGLKRPRGARSA